MPDTHLNHDEERLAAALAEAITSIVQERGSPGRSLDLVVSVRKDQVSVSPAPLSQQRPESFASWLRDRLGQAQLSKVALADQIGVSERTVRRWLAGDTEPRFQELLRLSSLFGNPPV